MSSDAEYYTVVIHDLGVKSTEMTPMEFLVQFGRYSLEPATSAQVTAAMRAKSVFIKPETTVLDVHQTLAGHLLGISSSELFNSIRYNRFSERVFPNDLVRTMFIAELKSGYGVVPTAELVLEHILKSGDLK